MNTMNASPLADGVVDAHDATVSAPEPSEPQYSRADQFMRKLLRVKTIDRSAKTQREAHRGFQISMVVSAVRCLITYLAVPIFIPILGFAGIVAAPIGIVLCIIAAVNGIYSVRKFWVSDYRGKWMYTWFIAVVFVVLAIALVTDISRIVGAL